jgi:ATP-dependent Lon protease
MQISDYLNPRTFYLDKAQDTADDKHSSDNSSSTSNSKKNSRLPEDVLILVPVRNAVLFPGVVAPISVGRESSIAAVREAVSSSRKIGLLLQHDPTLNDPGPTDLYRVGTVASIVRQVTAPDGSHHLVCQGEQRFRVLDYVPGSPFLVARVDFIREPETANKDIEARTLHLQQQAAEAIRLLPQAPAELANAVRSINVPGQLADLVAGLLDITPADKQEVLEMTDIRARLDKVSDLVSHRIQVLKLSQEIDKQTKQSLDERQREYVLREQLKTIQKELGEDETGDELEELAKAIDDAQMPEEVEQQARKELKRLRKMPEAAGEHAMIRTYLDWLIELPWAKLDEEIIDIAEARKVLEHDHYGLDKIKRRILEYLAVRKLNPEGRSPILCFVGPPGVGKTSLGQSIARALGLEFVRASLGGVHDEAEIRGHRRTYIGSLPGNIVHSIRKAGTRTPVFMLEEIDKLGSGGFHGDPSSALLEVLDPEQNGTFRDNYLGLPFDLSKVLFIATANVLDNIPGPLRDRMEVIELPGYTEDEKVQIARRYLVERQLKASGLQAEQAAVTDAALHSIVSDYTREAGCRNLERNIGAVLRNAAMRISEGTANRVAIDAEDLHGILGAKKFESEVAARTSIPGVATGLAWTPVGGDILFIETSRVPGHGKLILTGQLGDVMKESAQAALSLVKAHAGDLEIDPGIFENSDIHLHVPAGAIPKDGPSAGVAMYTSLVSLLSARTVDSSIAMTGEISLRGLVLPVGGIKEKCLAALRAGIKTVMLPARNRKDLEEIPENAREQLQFIWLDQVGDAVTSAIRMNAEVTG